MMKISKVVPGWTEDSGSRAEDADESLAAHESFAIEPNARITCNVPPARKVDVAYPFTDDLEVETWEAPLQIVEGILATGSTAALYGMPATGKTTLALSLATAICTGREFMGRVTIQGTVLYVASEGRAGFGPRVRAAKAVAGADGRMGLFIVSGAVALADEHAALIESIHRQLPEPPSLVIVDTLARAMLGLNENDQGDMGRVIRGVDAIRDGTGAAVLLIHHTTKDGGAERGSGALRGALDTLMKVDRKSNGVLILSSEKSRDLPPFDSVRFRIVPMDGGPIVRLVSTGDSKATPPARGAIPAQQLVALKALERIGGTRVRSADWKRAAEMPDSTFHNVTGRLYDAAYVARDQEGNAVFFSLLEKGRATLAG